MDRNREAKRGNTAAMNGALSRRRQRTNILRDSPEEDGGMEFQEKSRLRDRRDKKDRDRERSIRNRRRRGDRMLHASNRQEGEDSSEESLDEEEEEEDDEQVSVGIRPPPPSSSLPLNHHSRKNFGGKVSSSPTACKVVDEMIGVSVPRKARTGRDPRDASVKRSHECSLSGGGGGAEQIHRQSSTSPMRPNPGSSVPISPSSSNAFVRKKMKPTSGNKHKPPKVGKPPTSNQEIELEELEIAQVLFGLTNQIEHEIHKPDPKDANGSSTEIKSRVSSPNSFSPPPLTSQSSMLPTLNSASKRKRPRPRKFEDESPTSSPNLLAVPSTSISSTSRMEVEQPMQVEVCSPKLEKNMSSLATENCGIPLDSSSSQMVGMPSKAQQLSTKTHVRVVPDSQPLVPESDGFCQIENKGVTSAASKGPSLVVLNVNCDEAAASNNNAAAHVEKFGIDLMAPPPGKLSPGNEGLADHVTDHRTSVDIGTETKLVEEGRVESFRKQDALESFQEGNMEEKDMQEDLQVSKEGTIDNQIDIEKQDNNGFICKQLTPKLQSKFTGTELKPDRAVQAASLPLPIAVAGWTGGLPPFGYMGQVPSVPAVVPMGGFPGSSTSMQPYHLPSPPVRPERCATHCFIAQNIQYHQQLARISSFWPGPAGTAPIYGAKPYNLNVIPPESAVLGNPLQEGFPGRSLGSLHDKGVPVASFSGHSSKDKYSVAGTFIDMSPQKKQLLPQGGSTTNMVHAPAFIFPLNQQPAAAAASTRSAGVKSTAGASNLPPSSAPCSAVVSSGSSVASAPPVSFNCGSLPPSEAQYLAILRNNAYPFPMPAHVGAPHPYRGGSHAQFPFFNGSFYASQMLHPSQLQQQQEGQQQLQSQQPPSTQHGHQNTSTSSGSSSSQKHPQQPQRTPVGGTFSTVGNSRVLPTSKQRLLPHQARHLEAETGGEDSPSTADSRASQGQKNGSGQDFATLPRPQNFTLMASGAVNHSEKHHQQQQQSMKVDLTPSQTFAMSFAPFHGGGVPAPPSIDFSSLAQNLALFQNLPEAARQYQMAAAAAAAQAVQHKKTTHHQITEDRKIVEDRKVSSAGKALGSISQHTLAFSRPDNDTPGSTILGNSVIDSSVRTLNLIPGSVNGTRPSNRSAPGGPTTSGAVTAAAHASNSQHQQHSNNQQHNHHQLVLQRQQQQQQQQQQQMLYQQHQIQQQQLGSSTKSAASSNNVSVYSDRSTPGSTGTKFPNALSGFPQSLLQVSSPNQSPHWKNSTRTEPSAQPPSSVKSHLLQQPSRNAQQNPSTSGHYAQISFGVNSLKTTGSGQQLSAVNNNPSPPSAAAAVGSPPTSTSRSTGGSPRASTGGKLGPQNPTSQLQQQPPASKNSPSSSSRKSSPVSNRNAPSILGPPHNFSGSSSTSKQPQLKQPYPQQAQHFFSGPYLQQGQSFQPNPSAPFFQRRLSEPLQSTQQHQQQQQQHSNSASGSTGMLSLCPPALSLAGATTTSDPAKAVSAAVANSTKGLPPAGGLHAAQFAAVAAAQSGGGPHTLMSASGFPYLHAMPSVSVKPPEQKPAAGNDNLHACWQPEKR